MLRFLLGFCLAALGSASCQSFRARPLADAGRDNADGSADISAESPMQIADVRGGGDTTTDAPMPPSYVAPSGPVCTSSGFCWLSPLPTGSALVDIAGTSRNDIWALAGVSEIMHWDGRAWSGSPSGVTVSLRAVSAASLTAAYAVGAAGTIVRWTGVRWVTEKSSVAETLNDVWAVSDQEAYAVGNHGVLVHRTAAGWQVIDLSTTQDLTGVWAGNSHEVWAVGAAGTVVHWDGTTAKESSVGSRDLSAVSGFGAELWIVGAAGTVFRADGATWVAQDIAPPDSFADRLTGVWVNGRDDVWAVGPRFGTFHWNGTAWVSLADTSAPYVAERKSILGLGADDVWFVGASVDRWDGVALSRPIGMSTPLGTGTLFAIAGATTSDVWLGGCAYSTDGRCSSNKIFHWDGSSFADFSPTAFTFSRIRSIATPADGSVWAVGATQQLLRRTGINWESLLFIPVEELTSISGTIASSLLAVGTNATLLHVTGSGVAAINTASFVTPGASLTNVWMAGEREGWISGSDGLFHYQDGSVTADGPPHGSGSAGMIWGTASTDAWTFHYGAQTALLHRDDFGKWAAVTNPLSMSGFGSSAVPGRTWLATSRGELYEGDGNRWTPIDAGVAVSLTGIWAKGGEVWLIGDKCAVLKRAP